MARSKILIVEDDRTLLDVLRYNFTREGYETITAMNGAEAISRARSERPDLIILDLIITRL